MSGSLDVVIVGLVAYATAGVLYLLVLSVLRRCLGARGRRWADRLGPIGRMVFGVGVVASTFATVDLRAAGAEESEIARLVVIDEDSPVDDERPAPEEPAPVDVAPVESGTWTVAAGEHFWSIAEEHLAAIDPAASAADVARYWRRLVDANRDRLADPTDPDLVFVGQVFELPPAD